jgi:hypothetical protein
MQITADLDSLHYSKLTTLQTQLNQDIQTLLQLAIDDLYERHQLTPPMTEGQKSLAILRKNGFIGCLQGDGNFPQDYK